MLFQHTMLRKKAHCFGTVTRKEDMKTKNVLAASAMVFGGFASVYTQAMPLESNYYVRPGLRVGGGAFESRSNRRVSGA